MQNRVVESQFAPPLVVLGCVPVRARCAEARVLHLLSQTRPSRRRTTSLRGRGRKDRADRNRRICPVLRSSTAVNIRQSTTITSPQIPQSPSPTYGSGRLSSRENCQRTDTRVRTCGRKRLAVTRRVLPHTCWFCTHANTRRANYRIVVIARDDERVRQEARSRTVVRTRAVFRADCDGADVEPIACSLKHNERIDAALWVGIASVEQLARDLIIVRSSLRRRVRGTRRNNED